MDPLSITASVVGITTAALQSAQFLVKTIDNIKDAPGTIKDLSADLRVVESVLRELNANVQDDSLQIIRSSQIGPAVENCDRACKAFQSQVERWMKHSKEDKIFWISRWKIGLFGPDRIKTFKGQLNDCKSTLNIALTTANLFVSPQNRLILLVANLLNRLEVASQKELAKEQKDSILEATEADLEQELTRAGKEMVEIEQSLQRFTVGGSTERDEESEQSKKELLRELERQQAASTALRNMCEEALSRTVYQRTGQKIKGVKATTDGIALAGFINVPGEELNISQDISDVSADNRGFVIVGVANNVDIKDLRPR
jgi:predicted nucleotidyltransferase